ncbi:MULTISPECIES: hypothetical protein [unclassified Anabaena]|uniref:hypothetical protein n=1 Tax=unclassified Anabaena TaxID=2619674 RepID=UPI00082C41E4|nr:MULTISPECIES: hypothetical protein [unclassified Anabaena]
MSSYQSDIYTYSEHPSEVQVKKLADKILRSGKISPQDYELFTSTAFNNGDDISDGKRRQINRIFDQIQMGQLKLVNW